MFGRIKRFIVKLVLGRLLQEKGHLVEHASDKIAELVDGALDGVPQEVVGDLLEAAGKKLQSR